MTIIASLKYVNKRTLQQQIQTEAKTLRTHYTNDNRGRGNEAAGFGTTKHSLTGELYKLTHSQGRNERAYKYGLAQTVPDMVTKV